LLHGFAETVGVEWFGGVAAGDVAFDFVVQQLFDGEVVHVQVFHQAGEGAS